MSKWSLSMEQKFWTIAHKSLSMFRSPNGSFFNTKIGPIVFFAGFFCIQQNSFGIKGQLLFQIIIVCRFFFETKEKNQSCFKWFGSDFFIGYLFVFLFFLMRFPAFRIPFIKPCLGDFHRVPTLGHSFMQTAEYFTTLWSHTKTREIQNVSWSLSM